MRDTHADRASAHDRHVRIHRVDRTVHRAKVHLSRCELPCSVAVWTRHSGTVTGSPWTSAGRSSTSRCSTSRPATLTIEKQPATASKLAEEFLTGLGRLPVAPADIGRLFHGTTVAINAVLQERGVKVGLLTTRGFRDVLAIGRGARPEIYNFFYSPPESLVPRYLRREVTERTAADGSELEPLSLDERRPRAGAAPAARRRGGCRLLPALVRESGARAQRGRAHPRRRIPISPSPRRREVATEWREFERTSTTVLNSLHPAAVRGATSATSASGCATPATRVRSRSCSRTAASSTRRRASQLPIRTLESGPAGGVIGARALAAELGYAERDLRRRRRDELRRRAHRGRGHPRADRHEGRRPSGRRAGHRHRLDRSGRRLDRLDRRPRRRAGRAAERGRASGPGVLRPRRRRSRP